MLTGRMRHAGGGVGRLLVERLGLEQRLRERVQLAALARQQLGRVGVRLVGQPPHLGVDDLLRVLRGLRDPGQQLAVWPSEGSTATGPIAGLMPQRPTIWRAIAVICWMSDSAPELMLS